MDGVVKTAFGGAAKAFSPWNWPRRDELQETLEALGVGDRLYNHALQTWVAGGISEPIYRGHETPASRVPEHVTYGESVIREADEYTLEELFRRYDGDISRVIAYLCDLQKRLSRLGPTVQEAEFE